MKKRNLKSLKINKKTISSLHLKNTNGGAIDISKIIGCITVARGCPVETGSCESWGSVFVCECTL